MRKSRAYDLAMIAVVNSDFTAEMKVDVLSVLAKDKELAECSEELYEAIERDRVGSI
jgi:hypothetical protein